MKLKKNHNEVLKDTDVVLYIDVVLDIDVVNGSVEVDVSEFYLDGLFLTEGAPMLEPLAVLKNKQIG
jgi:hypothetical protein